MHAALLEFVGEETRGERKFLVVQLIRQAANIPLDPMSIHAESDDGSLPTHAIDDQILVDISQLHAGKHTLSIGAKDMSGAKPPDLDTPTG